MGDFDIPCFFITGKAPDFPMPDLALGCLMKPFTAEDIHRSLAAAEDLMRGREALRPKMPVNLMLYDKVEEEGAEPAARLYPFTPLAEDPARALDRRDAALRLSARPLVARRPEVRVALSGGRCHPGTWPTRNQSRITPLRGSRWP